MGLLWGEGQTFPPLQKNELDSDNCCNSDQNKICTEHRGEGCSFQLGGEKSFMEGLPLTLALKVREDFNKQRWGLVGRAGSAGECAGRVGGGGGWNAGHHSATLQGPGVL